MQSINTFLIIQAQIYCSSSSKCHIFKHPILSHKILAFFVFKNVPFSLGQWVWRECPFSFLPPIILLPSISWSNEDWKAFIVLQSLLPCISWTNKYWREFIIFPFFWIMLRWKLSHPMKVQTHLSSLFWSTSLDIWMKKSHHKELFILDETKKYFSHRLIYHARTRLYLKGYL